MSLRALGPVLAAALLLGAPAGAHRPVQNVPGELRAREEALRTLRQRLQAAEARAAAARAREASLLEALEALDRSLARKRRALERLGRRADGLERTLAAVGEKRGRATEETRRRRDALASGLGTLDRLRRATEAPGPLGESLGARTRNDLARLLRFQAERLVAAAAAGAALEAEAARVRRLRARLGRLREAVEAERAALEDEAERRRRLLADAREDRVTHERLVAELGEARRQLERLVEDLRQRAEARARFRPAIARPGSSAAAAPGPSSGLGAQRGRLPWPVEGRVVEEFGRQVHPRFGTETFRTGIAIEAPEGALVRAVHAGTVLYRGWLRGYGNLIVLDHGEGYFTLYGHASALLVGEGDRVAAGQGIARVGETGSLGGARLHFEVRVQGRPEDPRVWLRPPS